MGSLTSRCDPAFVLCLDAASDPQVVRDLSRKITEAMTDEKWMGFMMIASGDEGVESGAYGRRLVASGK